MTEAEPWLQSNTFFCPPLNARLTPDQCRLNRERREKTTWNSVDPADGGPPPSCQRCTKWKEYQSGMKGQIEGEPTTESKVYKKEPAQEKQEGGWELVEPKNRGKRRGLVAWFDSKAYLTFSADVAEKFNLKDGDQFHVFYDASRNRIGLKKINYADPKAFTYRKRYGTRKICLTEVARRAKPRIGEPFVVDLQDGMLCLEVTKTQKKATERKR